MGMELGEAASQDENRALARPGHADFVAEQMSQLSLDIEQLLQLSQDVTEQVRRLREDLQAARQSGEPLSAPQQQALVAQLQAAQRDLVRLTEALRLAYNAGQRLQAELPAAEWLDVQERLTRAESERARLEKELEPIERQLVQRTGEGLVSADNYRKRHVSKAAAKMKGPVSESPLAADADDTVERPTASLGDLPAKTQRELGKIVEIVNQLVSSPRGTRAGGKTTGWHTTPISSMTATLQSRWSTFIAQMNVEGWMDVNQLIQWVMREAYVANTEDLKFYAHRVKFFTDLKKLIRSELTRARAFQSTHQQFNQGESTLAQPYDLLSISTTPQVNPDGSLSPRAPAADGTTTDGRRLEEYIKGLDQLLGSVGDDAQLAQLDLQTVTQKQQQTLQTLSNLSKVLHETSMAIIRKIGS